MTTRRIDVWAACAGIALLAAGCAEPGAGGGCDPYACDRTCRLSGLQGGICTGGECECVGAADADGDGDSDTGTADDFVRPEYDDEFWGDGACGGEEISLTRLPTNLVFVVDRSSSMLDPSDPTHTPTTAELGSCVETNSRPATGIGYVTRWDDVKSGVNGVVAGASSEINFGLTLFPGPGALSGTGDPVTLFCSGTAAPRTTVRPGAGTAAGIAASLDDPDSMPVCNGGFTPTRDGLLAARAALDVAAEPGPGVIVLATDGAPNCNGARSPGCTCTTGTPFCNGTLGYIGCLDDARTIATISELLAAGYKTYVVGIPGSEVFADVLDRMADAGGAARSGSPRYYRVENRDELAAALGTIAAGEESCRFNLGSIPPDEHDINVFVDERPLRRDDPDGNGFTYDSATNTVELRGADCDDLRAGRISTVRFIFGCPPVL
ncbi:MAG: hypothetical protein QME96_16290 [Myxococcota bacterium]|nr:hypothetical protein [Myxococcota bacterium]